MLLKVITKKYLKWNRLWFIWGWTEFSETALISEVPSTINDENLIIAPGQGTNPVLILSDECCEEQAFPYLLPKDKFGYKAPRTKFVEF